MFGLLKYNRMTKQKVISSIQQAVLHTTLDMAARIAEDQEVQADCYYLWIEQNGEVKAIYNENKNGGFIRGECFYLSADGRKPHTISTPQRVIPVKETAPMADFVIETHAQNICDAVTQGGDVDAAVDELAKATAPLIFMFYASSGLMMEYG